jgi:hypothetical protein
MKITLVNSLSFRDYWYNLRKVYNFYSLSESERTALSNRQVACGFPFRLHVGFITMAYSVSADL